VHLNLATNLGGIAMRTQRSKEEQKRICTEFRNSGLTQTAFCTAHGVNVKSLGRWLKNIVVTENELKFLPVTGFSKTLLEKIEIILPNGICLKVTTGTSLKELVRELL
jgi:hypothetical protein